MTHRYENLIPKPCITFQTTKTEPLDSFCNNLIPTIFMDQCHLDTIAVLTNPQNIPTLLEQTDAVITTIPNIRLVVKTADCLPILIYHPLPLIAAIHAGRKSTDLNIFEKTLVTIKTQFKIQNNLSIWFGPHIHEKQYEIDASIKKHYNLAIKNKTQLLNVFPENTHTFFQLNKCTITNNNEFFSFRKEKTKERHYSGIQII